MNSILEYLRQLLKCPICFKQMTPPITFCCNSHLICSACKPGHQDCPTCHGNLTNMRNFSMERFSEMLSEIDRAEEPVPASSTETGNPSVDFIVVNQVKNFQCCKCKQYMIFPYNKCVQCAAFICTHCNPEVKPHKCVEGNKQIILVRYVETEVLLEVTDYGMKILKFKFKGSPP